MKITMREHLKQEIIDSNWREKWLWAIGHRGVSECNIVLLDGKVLKSRYHGASEDELDEDFLESELEFESLTVREFRKNMSKDEFLYKNVAVISE